MNEPVTVVVVPRDRFDSVVECARTIIENTDVPFRFAFLDFGYSKRTLKRLREVCGEIPTEIIQVDRMVPMEAFAKYLPKVQTEYLAWVDNDTFVTPGWMSSLMALAAQGARVILPVTLEREGLDIEDRRLPLRNHISHSELRKVVRQGEEFVFDYKPFRRAAPEDLPQEPHLIDFFEFHAVFGATEAFRQLDIPPMVVREHVDFGIQFNRLGIPIWCDPKSVVHFDNLNERPTFADLRFFFFRWRQSFIDRSHELFYQRWGYRFLNETFMKNWASRRKVFSVFRFLGLPVKFCDLASRVYARLFARSIPAWKLADPLPESQRVLQPLDAELSGVAGGVG